MFKLLRNPGVLAALSAAGGMVNAANDVNDKERQRIEKEKEYQQQYARQLGTMNYSQQMQEDAAGRSFNREAAWNAGTEGGMAAAGIPADIASARATEYTSEQQRKTDEEGRRVADDERRGRLNEAQMKTQQMQQEELQKRRQREETKAAYEVVIQDLVAKGDFPAAKKNIEQLKKENPTWALELGKTVESEEKLFKSDQRRQEVERRYGEWQDYVMQAKSKEDLEGRILDAWDKKRFSGIDQIEGFTKNVAALRAQYPEDGEGNVQYGRNGEVLNSSAPSMSLAEQQRQRMQADRIAPSVPQGQMFTPGANIDIIATPEDRYGIQQNATGGMDTAGAQPATQQTSADTTGVQPAISTAPTAGIRPARGPRTSAPPPGIDQETWDAYVAANPSVPDSTLRQQALIAIGR